MFCARHFWLGGILSLCLAATSSAVTFENSSHQMAAGNFDVDGANELAYIRALNDWAGSGSPLAGPIFLRDFNGGLPRVALPGVTATQVVAADINGDGRDEVVFIDGTTSFLRSYNFVTSSFTTHNNFAIQDVTAGQIDGDAQIELLTADVGSTTIRTFDAVSSIFSTLPAGGGAGNNVAANFNNNGLTDFAVRNSNNYGSGGLFTIADPYAGFTSLGGGLNRIATGNLDGAGDASDEVFLTNSGNAIFTHGAGGPNNSFVQTAAGTSGTDPTVGHPETFGDGRDLGYVIGTGGGAGIIHQGTTGWNIGSGATMNFTQLRQTASVDGSAAVTGNANMFDLIAADVTGDGLDEILGRQTTDSGGSVHFFQNGAASFAQQNALVTLTASDPAASSSFAVAGNWSNAAAPSLANNYQVDSGRTLRTTLDVGSETFGGASLTIQAGSTLSLHHTGTDTIDNLILNGGTILQGGNTANTTMTLAGAINLTANSTIDTAGRNLDLSATVNGPAGFTKAGGGTLNLNGVASYTGGTTVNGGTLNIAQVGSGSNNANVGVGANGQLTTSAISVAPGALLNLNTGSNFSSANGGTTITGAGTLRLSSGTWWLGNAGGGTTISMGAGGLIDVLSGATLKNDYANANWAANQASLNVAGGGNFNLRNNNVTVDALTGAGSVFNDFATNTLTVGVAGGSGTFSGTIGPGGTSMHLTKNGAGTQTLSGTNTYTGNTTINGGTLQIGGAGSLGSGAYSGAITNNSSLQYSSSAAQTLSGGLSGTGSLVKDTSGSVLTLSGAGVAYTGATTVNAGTLALNVTTGYASSTTVNSGAALELAGAANAEHASWTGNALTLNNGSTLNKTNTGYDTINSGNVIVNGTVAMNISNNGSNNQLFIGGVGSTGLTGAGTLTITNTGTSTTGLTVRSGVHATHFDGDVIVNGGALNIGPGAGLTFDNAHVTLNGARLTLDGSAFATGGATNASLEALSGNTSGSVILGGQTLTVGTNNGTGGNFAGVISGTGGLTKTGSGTQTLGGVNTYSGSTTISGGTLRLQAPAVTLPASLSGLVVHLDANNVTGVGNPANGTAISTWTNLAVGGAGNFTLHPGNAQAPYLNWTNNPLNGNSVVHFWGGLLQNTTNFGNNVSVMYVGRMDGGANERLVASTANNWLLGYWGTGMDRVYWQGSPANLTGSGAVDFNSHIYAGIADGTNAFMWNFDGNEVLWDSGALGGGGQGPNGLALGGWDNNGATPGGITEQSYADIGELLVFNRALTATERAQMQQYLQSRWSGVLPSITAVDITASGATLDLNGVNQTIGSLAGVVGSAVLLNGGDLTVGRNNASTTFSGVIADGTTSGGGLSKEGTGTLTLAGTAANTYSGTTVISRGQMALSKSANVAAIPGNLVMLNSLSPTMWTTADNQFAAGSVLSFDTEVNNGIGNARFNLVGTTQTLAGIVSTDSFRQGVIQNSETIGGAPANSGNSTLVLNGSGNYSFNAYLRDASGTLGLIKDGTGTQTLVGDRISYSGTTVVNSGTLTLQTTAVLSGAQTVNGGTLEWVNQNNGGSSSKITGVTTVNAGGTLEIDSTILFATRWNHNALITGAGTINKTGTGVFGTNGTFSPSGTLNILAGRLHNDNVTGNWTGATADVNISAGAVLDLRANDIYVDALNGPAGAEIWNSHSAGGNSDVLFIGVANGSGTFAGIIRGNDSQGDDNPDAAFTHVTKRGDGTQVFAGGNTYAGATRVEGGTLELAANGSIAATSGVTVGLAGNGTNDRLLLTNPAAHTLGTGDLVVGSTEAGTVDHDAGTVTVGNAATDAVRLGAGGAGITGVYNINNMAMSTLNVGPAGSGNLIVGDTSTGILNVGPNATVNTGDLLVGNTATGIGTVNQSGGTLNVTNPTTYSVGAGGGMATVNHTGGTTNVTGNMLIGNSVGPPAENNYNLNGVGSVLDFGDTLTLAPGAHHQTNLTPSTLDIRSDGQFNFNSGTLLDVSTVNANNSASGSTPAGTFHQNGTTALWEIGQQNTGPAGLTTLNGNLLQSSGTIAFDVFGYDVNNTPWDTMDDMSNNPIDLLIVNGDAQLGGTVDVDFFTVLPPVFGDVFPLMKITGDVIIDPTFHIDGGFFRVVEDGMGNFTLQAIVPEPGTVAMWSLLALAAGGFAVRMRGRRRG